MEDNLPDDSSDDEFSPGVPLAARMPKRTARPIAKNSRQGPNVINQPINTHPSRKRPIVDKNCINAANPKRMCLRGAGTSHQSERNIPFPVPHLPSVGQSQQSSALKQRSLRTNNTQSHLRGTNSIAAQKRSHVQRAARTIPNSQHPGFLRYQPGTSARTSAVSSTARVSSAQSALQSVRGFSQAQKGSQHSRYSVSGSLLGGGQRLGRMGQAPSATVARNHSFSSYQHYDDQEDSDTDSSDSTEESSDSSESSESTGNNTGMSGHSSSISSYVNNVTSQANRLGQQVTSYLQYLPHGVSEMIHTGNTHWNFNGTTMTFSNQALNNSQIWVDNNLIWGGSGNLLMSNPQRAAPGNHLSESEIGRLPTRAYVAPTGGDSSQKKDLNKQCLVCHMDCGDGEILRILPCFHEFHASCIDPWLKINRSCPVCRVEVDVNDDDV